MSRILFTYATTAAAVVAIALVFVSNIGAQEEQQEQQKQSADQQSEQQKAEQQQKEQQQSSQEQQRQNEEQQQANQQQQAEQQTEQQQQAEQQRQKQEDQQRSRDQQRDRGQSSEDRWSEPRESRWPQPDGSDYGSDSLEYRSERDSQSGERQGGLGVSLSRDANDGVIVSRVHPGSPAEEMGIRERDRITQVNGREVRSVQQFIARIRNMRPGQRIELDIRRAAGGERTVRGELESRDEALAESDRQPWRSSRQRGDWDEDPDRSWQTSFEEERRTTVRRGDQLSGNQLDQIERQVDRLSRELDQLRFALQDLRRQSGEGRSERTASYDEYQSSDEPGRMRDRRGDRRFRQAERDSLPRSTRYDGQRQSSDRYESSDPSDQSPSTRGGSGSDTSESRDSYDESPGGETGEDRLRVGSEEIDRE